MKRILLSISIFGAFFGTTAPELYAAELPTVIALFGDSTTVGYVPPGNPETFEDRYGNGTTTRGLPTSHLAGLLNDGPQKRPSIVTNWGIGGTSTGVATDNGLSRISNNLATAKSTHSGSKYYVLILYGLNDFAYGIGESDTRVNLEQMIDIARGRGFDPILGTVTPRSDHNMVPYNTQIKQAGSNKGVFVVDHYQVFISTAPPNGYGLLTTEYSPISHTNIQLHPKADSYRLMAETWFSQRLQGLITPLNPISSGALQLLLLDDDVVPPAPPPEEE